MDELGSADMNISEKKKFFRPITKSTKIVEKYFFNFFFEFRHNYTPNIINLASNILQSFYGFDQKLRFGAAERKTAYFWFKLLWFWFKLLVL